MINTEQEWIAQVVEKICTKMEWVSEKSKDKIPYTTIDGIHDDRSVENSEWRIDEGLSWWCNGFWSGIMWQMYHETGAEKFAKVARVTEEKLEKSLLQYYGLHHDVGFMWLLSSVADYRLTNNLEGKRQGMIAANLLAGRFNIKGNYIRAWNDGIGVDEGKPSNRGWAIIDCLMNIPLLYWASEETNDPRFKHIAIQHADTVMEHFVRDDGSVRHIVEFDAETGERKDDFGGQGYEKGSSWTRGQAWGLYGFVLSYIHTQKEEYLNTAKRIAHYFIANIPESGLIPVDFRQPQEPAWEDSTAAAIASSALITLAEMVGEYEKGLYLKSALQMLRILDEKRCNWGMDNDCIVEKCTEAYHTNRHEINIIYGDYFFIEAIFKLKGSKLNLW